MSKQNEGPGLPAGLPPCARLQRVAFAAGREPGRTVLLEFPAPVGRLAVLVDDGTPAETSTSEPDGDLLVLSVPGPLPDDADLLPGTREWAESAGHASQVLTFQGARIVWAPGRAVVFAPEDRLEAARKALIEAAYYDAELTRLELELCGMWPGLEADSPLAFAFNSAAICHRGRLAERFRRVVSLRARLARITPQVLCPHAHPPTLASQVGERIRERTRMAHRVESFGGQLEVFERVYDACGQRASDYMLARAGHILEWVIVLLLLAQSLMVAADILFFRGE